MVSRSSMRRACRENRALDALHKRLRARRGLNRALLQVVNFLELLLDPSVPEVERYLLFLALGVQFARGHGENKVSILLVIDDFERQTTLNNGMIWLVFTILRKAFTYQSKVFLFWVFTCISLPFLANCAC